MHTEIKSPGEKYAIESQSLYGFLDSSHKPEAQGRTSRTPSTAHLSSNWEKDIGFAFDELATFCSVLLSENITEPTVQLFASNVLELVSVNIHDLKRRVEQILPVHGAGYIRGMTIHHSDFETLRSLADSVRHDRPKENLKIVDDDMQPLKHEPRSTVNYAHHSQPVRFERKVNQFPNFVEHNQDMYDLSYDNDITPFDSEEE